MTKYILAGGADRKYADYGEALAKEIFKTIDKPIRLLSCFFAEPREIWEAKFAARQMWLRENFGEDGSYEMAFPDSFRSQIKHTDVVYLHGGDDDLLAYRLSQLDNLAQLFKGKIVIGSSAGANWLAQSFWTCDWREVRQGSGLTALNVIPHYESEEYGVDDPRGRIDWSRAQAELEATIGAGKTTTLLREGKFVVVEQ